MRKKGEIINHFNVRWGNLVGVIILATVSETVVDIIMFLKRMLLDL